MKLLSQIILFSFFVALVMSIEFDLYTQRDLRRMFNKIKKTVNGTSQGELLNEFETDLDNYINDYVDNCNITQPDYSELYYVEWDCPLNLIIFQQGNNNSFDLSAFETYLDQGESYFNWTSQDCPAASNPITANEQKCFDFRVIIYDYLDQFKCEYNTCSNQTVVWCIFLNGHDPQDNGVTVFNTGGAKCSDCAIWQEFCNEDELCSSELHDSTYYPIKDLYYCPWTNPFDCAALPGRHKYLCPNACSNTDFSYCSDSTVYSSCWGVTPGSCNIQEHYWCPNSCNSCRNELSASGFLSYINDIRSDNSVSNLTEDSNLTSLAQIIGRSCDIYDWEKDHFRTENLFGYDYVGLTWYRDTYGNIVNAMLNWENEGLNWTGSSCNSTTHQCANFTQVINPNTSYVGCGVGTCYGEGWLWVCAYGEGGNHLYP